MKSGLILLVILVAGGGFFAVKSGLVGGGDDLANVATNAAQIAKEKGVEAVEDNIGAVKDGAMEKSKEVISDATDKVVDEGRQKIGDVVKEVGENIANPQGQDQGSFEDYAPEKIGINEKVVLDFAADWCPSCRAFERDVIENEANIPSNLTILKVDYDKESELKKKYGVTLQHTFVQVDEQGELVEKWTGSPNLELFLAKVQ
jgi:thiol-disulfide isomerase/thioredoxin